MSALVNTGLLLACVLFVGGVLYIGESLDAIAKAIRERGKQ